MPRQRKPKALSRIANGAMNISGSLIKSIVKGVTPALTAAVVAKVGGVALKALPRPKKMRKRRPMALSSVPAAVGFSRTTTGASVRTGSSGNARISHSEQIGDVIARLTTFDLQYRFGINPGNTALFPWLSTIANRYETYKFLNLEFRFVPTCGTDTQGIVMMAIDYDASDPDPNNQQQLMAYCGAVMTNSWKPSIHHSAGPDLHRLKTNYVLSGVPPSNTDIKTYDIGNFFLAVNSTADTSLGQLFVDYTVELMTPQIVNDPPSVSYSTFVPGATADSSGVYDIFADDALVGPLGAFVVPTTTPNQWNIFVAQAGFYVFTFYAVWNLPTGAETFEPNFSYPQNNNLFHQGVFDTVTGSPDDTQNYATIAQFAVLDPDQPAITCSAYFENANTTHITSLGVNWQILPISQSCIVEQNYMPPPAAVDPRRRFGRIPIGTTF